MANELLQRSTCASTYRVRCESPMFQAAARLKLDPGADVSQYKVSRKSLRGAQLSIELHDGIRTSKEALWNAVTDGIPALTEFLPHNLTVVTELAKEVLEEVYKYGVLNMVTVRGGASGILRWLVHHSSPTCSSKELALKLGVSPPTPYNVFTVIKQLLTPSKLARFDAFHQLVKERKFGAENNHVLPPFRNDKHFSGRRMKKKLVETRRALRKKNKISKKNKRKNEFNVPRPPKIKRKTICL